MTAPAPPKVSVVIPLYNRGAYIAATLRSVLEQSFTDFEVIVVDDGSTDDSAENARAVVDPHRRVRYLRRENSGRPATPRNQGIRESRGQYVAFLDSDDLWHPHKLERQVALLDGRPDAGMVYSWAAYFDGERDLGHCGPTVGSMPERIFEALLMQGCFPLIGTVVVPRRVLDQVGVFNQDIAYRAVEDYDLWLRIAHDFPALFMPEVTMRYRMHDGNISSDKHEIVGKWRDVIEANCERFGVDPRLRTRALARAHVIEFKMGLEAGDPAALGRQQLQSALALDPGDPLARLLLRLVDTGLYRPLQFGYRHRRHATRLRDRLNRLTSKRS